MWKQPTKGFRKSPGASIDDGRGTEQLTSQFQYEVTFVVEGVRGNGQQGLGGTGGVEGGDARTVPVVHHGERGRVHVDQLLAIELPFDTDTASELCAAPSFCTACELLSDTIPY